MALALAGSMHFQRQSRTTGVLAPIGALVPLAIGGSGTSPHRDWKRA